MTERKAAEAAEKEYWRQLDDYGTVQSWLTIVTKAQEAGHDGMSERPETKCSTGRLADGRLCKLPGHVHSPWWCEFCPHPEICAPAEHCFAEQHGLNYDTDEDGAPRG